MANYETYGFCGLIQKPFNFPDIGHILDSVLNSCLCPFCDSDDTDMKSTAYFSDVRIGKEMEEYWGVCAGPVILGTQNSVLFTLSLTVLQLMQTVVDAFLCQ